MEVNKSIKLTKGNRNEQFFPLLTHILVVPCYCHKVVNFVTCEVLVTNND